MNNKSIKLGHIQETLLLPLWGRAVESQKENPLLIDKTAVKIVHEIDYDFSTIAKNIHPLTRLAWVARSLYFDREIIKYLEKYPNATVVNIGCGFDTTFERIDNGKVIWFDLDLPDVIELRRQYILETERRKFISGSVFGNNWYSEIANKEQVILFLAGVIYYFKEEDVKKLFKEFVDHFGSVDILFDYCSIKGMKISNKKVLEQGGMDQKAKLVWGINDINKIAKWDERIKIVNTMSMYKDIRKNYPPLKRLGMMITDLINIMSLCHITISDKNDM